MCRFANHLNASDMKKSAIKVNNFSLASVESKSAILELFTDEIRDLYWVEYRLSQSLLKMQKAASSEQLQDVFAFHFDQTLQHIVRLEKVFELLEEKAQGRQCNAIEGLVAEGKGMIEDTVEGTSTRDIALILAAQKVEHYEIATYGGLCKLAKTIGREDIAEILDLTLSEEMATEELLTKISENKVSHEGSYNIVTV